MNIGDERRGRISAIAEKHGLAMVLVFGSAVTGARHQGSDVDVAVQFEGDVPDLMDCAELIADLQAVFPEGEVDLAIVNRADPLFLAKIVENSVLLHGDPARLQELRIYAFKRYQDHRRYFDMERAYVADFLRKAASR